MRLPIDHPDWHLNYEVAALGAYATILVEAIHILFGGFDDASPISISLLTNGSAVLFTPHAKSRATPLAAVRIYLTATFLLWGVVTAD